MASNPLLDTIFCHVYCAPMYNVHPCFWPKLSGEKIFHFNFLIQLFIYLYLETTLMITFQGIVLHVDSVIAF